MSKLPQFSAMQIPAISSTLEHILTHNKKTINHLITSVANKTWLNFILPLDDLTNDLELFWNQVEHLNAVTNSEQLRLAYQKCLPLLSDYSNYLSQNIELFNAYASVIKLDKSLNSEQKEQLNQEIRDFKLSGMQLPPAQKKTYREITKRLSELSNQFANNVLDATSAWSKHITNLEELAGIPASSLEQMQQLAAAKNLSGYLITLDAPIYISVMTYAQSRSLRQEVYTAYVTRASDQTPTAEKFDNTPIMDEILKLKQDKAQLLDFANYSNLSIATKMVESTTQVLDFLHNLIQSAKDKARFELEQLQQFTRQQFNIATLAAWDITYFSEKLKQHLYQYTDEDIRPYFPLNTVLSGLFKIIKTLYEIEFKPIYNFDTWHPNVLLYQLETASGETIGHLYMDLHTRANKRSGAWMNECRMRYKKTSDEIQLPIAYLTTNITPPTATKPSLLTHDEAITIFHEMGHCLQHLLTTVEAKGVSGISGVPWDAVELASQMMENFCWTTQGLNLISGHYENNKPLPEELRQKMLGSKNFQAALAMLRQLEFSLFDFELHQQNYAPNSIYPLLNTIRQQTAVIEVPEYNRFANSFCHIFAGGYAAGYYSYKWAEVLASDCFAVFERNGVLNRKIGKKFQQCILQPGGSKNAMELFEKFCGHKPSVESLLQRAGISA